MKNRVTKARLVFFVCASPGQFMPEMMLEIIHTVQNATRIR
jgi:hypothetical protein